MVIQGGGKCKRGLFRPNFASASKIFYNNVYNKHIAGSQMDFIYSHSSTDIDWKTGCMEEIAKPTVVKDI